MKISFLPLPESFDCCYFYSEESDLQKHLLYKHCQAHYGPLPLGRGDIELGGAKGWILMFNLIMVGLCTQRPMKMELFLLKISFLSLPGGFGCC